MVDRRHRITWTITARAALDDIANHIAGDSRAAARNLVERIVAAAESLETLAHRGRPVPEIADPSIRELIIQPFRLIYRVASGEVLIITVLHEARDFERWRSNR